MRKIFPGWFCLLMLCTACQSDAVKIPASRYPDRAFVEEDPSAFLRVSDSLLQQKNGLGKGERIPILLSRQRAFSLLNMPDSVLSTGVQIRVLAGDLGDSISMAKSLLYIRGSVSAEQQRLFAPYLEGALRAFRKEGWVYEQGVIFGLMGFVQTREGDVAKAVVYLQEARSLLEPLDSFRALYPVMLNLGNSYSALGQFTEAEKFSKKALGCADRMKDSLRIAMALQNLAIVFQSQQKSDSVILYLQTSARYVPKSAGAFFPLQLQYNLADAYRMGGAYVAAEQQYQQVKEAFQQLGSQEGVAMADRGLALLYAGSGRLTEAIGLMERSIRGLDAAGNRIQVAEQYQEMVDLYTRAGDLAAALEVVSRLKVLKDSLFSEEKSLAVKELEVRYQTKQKEDENRLLRAEVRWKNRVSIGLLLILLLLVSLLFVLRQRNRYNRELNRTYERLISQYIQERDATNLHLAGSTQTNPTPAVSVETALDEQHLEKDEVSTLYERLLAMFQQEKLHLNPDLSVDAVAEKLGVSTRKLALVLKSAGNTSYSKLVNQFRVAEASRLLEDPSSGTFKLDGIATMSGFTNRQHFRRVFEQVTGVNPGYYRKVRMKETGPDRPDTPGPGENQGTFSA